MHGYHHLNAGEAIFQNRHTTCVDENRLKLILKLGGLMSVVISANSIATRVKNSLLQLGYSQMRTVQCQAVGSTIVLTGELDSFYMAQVAQTIAAKVPGVRGVENRVNIA